VHLAQRNSADVADVLQDAVKLACGDCYGTLVQLQAQSITAGAYRNAGQPTCTDPGFWHSRAGLKPYCYVLALQQPANC
jgi:hypothetical protein